MIKVVAFDLVGVLVNEKDIELTPEEDKLERMFGSNINDADYLIDARKIIDKDSILMRTTEELINKIYKVKDCEIFKKIKEINSNLKIIIATNHVSFVRNFIGESFGVDYLDDVLISAEIHKVKPNSDFYEYVINKYNIKPNELLFLDDNIENVDSANKLGINTIKINKDTDLYKEVSKWLKQNN
ncbi:MAG: HAD-IA family hydrolase [Bacilli bacterium]